MIATAGGGGAFSFNSSGNHQEAPTERNDDDDSGDEEDEAIDCIATNVMDFILLFNEGEDTRQGDNVPIKKKRQPKRKRAIWVDDDASVRRISPKQTVWYSAYILNPDLEDPKFHKIFRRRFRLPYAQFLELGERLESHEIFARWHSGNVNPFTQEPPTPIPLLLLTSLRYLGRGWTFDDLAENTAMHEETIRVFFHCFIDYGSSVLYGIYIRPPTCADEAQAHTSEYAVAGFAGAIGSTDATHILLERVAYRLRQTHIGFKMTHTARTYNITVNHRRQILATTTGHPARWNDKTLALFDCFMTDLKNGEIMNDMFFDLYERGGPDGDTIVKRCYQGAWLLVDNGYLAWPTTVPPIKTTSSRVEIRFLSWLESMRKDVECTFGILKGRWRILKTGICLTGVENADKIFLTCCALRNWLLDVDGLSETWDGGVATCTAAGVQEGDDVQGGWDGEMGQYDEEDFAVLPAAIRNLNNPVAMRSYDLSGMGPGSDAILTDGEELETYVEECIASNAANNNHSSNDQAELVCELSLAEFRQRLINHFNIAYHRGEVEWPTTKGRGR